MIKVIYNKVCGRCVQSEPLTSGMVGQPIEFEYSPDFDGLTLTAVFTNGKTTVDVLNPGNQCLIPHEVLDTPGTTVSVGIYATRGNELVIPTVYAAVGIVLKGADPSGDTEADPTLPIWAQIQALIGNLADLETEAKNNLVAAINEAAQTGSGSGTAYIAMRIDGGYIQYTVDGKTWANLIAVADLKGAQGADGHTPVKGVDYFTEADKNEIAEAAASKVNLSSYRTAEAQDVIDSGKVDKVTGKGLSSNDYTDDAKAKVDAIPPNPQYTDTVFSGSYNDLTDKPTIPSVPTATIEANAAARHTHDNKTLLDSITEALKTAWDTASEWISTNGANVLSHLSDGVRHITATERSAWNSKQDKITSTNKLAYSLISGTPTIPTVPTNVSAFTNDAGYLTLATLPKYEGVVE